MRFHPIRISLRARLKNPAFWLVSAVLLLIPAVLFKMLPLEPSRWKFILSASAVVVCFLPGIALSPVPWQWSGDDRSHPGWLRGLGQFLLFITGLALLLSAALMAINGAKLVAWIAFMAGVFTDLLIFLCPTGLIMARLERMGRETREAEQRAQEVRWMGSRGSFSPRLLFSNLQYLANLAENDALGTEQGLLDLAALYRQGIIESEHPLIPFSTECSLAEHYLDLERPRWGVHLVVRWHLDPDVDECAVPPLLLLPLLEALLAPGPESGALHLNIRTQQSEKEWVLRLIQSEPSPMPSAAVIETTQQRLCAVLGKGIVTCLPLGDGWEFSIRLSFTGAAR